MVVQSDAMLQCSVVLIAPASTRSRSASFRPEVEIDGEKTEVLVEQMGAVDVSRLGDLVGHLTAEESLCLRRPAKPWQRLYLRPDPQGHRSFRPILAR